MTYVRRVSLALAAALPLAVAACASAPTPLFPDPARAAVRLSDGDVEAVAIALRLEDRREFDGGELERLAASPTVEVRRRAALAAGRTGDPAAAPFLARLLGDPAPAVRADAAFALGELGDSSAATVRALEAAVRGDWTPVRPEQTTVVVEIVGALGKLRTDAARALVLGALRGAHPARDPHARRVAAEALLAVWKLGAGPGSVTPVLPYLDAADPELRWRAAYALMRMAAPGTVPPLLAVADDADARAHAARALSASAADSAGLRAPALRALSALIDDPDPHVRIAALRSLGGYGEAAPIEAVAARLHDERPDVAIAAAAALGALADTSDGTGRAEVADAAPSRLAATAAATGRPLALRAAAARELAALDPDAAATIADEWATGDAALRYHAARLLSALAWERAGERLRALVQDDDRRVAAAALASAESLAADSTLQAPARAALRALLADVARHPDPRLRAMALRAAGALPDEDAARLPADSAALEAAVSAAERDATPVPPPGDDLEFYRAIARDYVARPLATGERPEARILTEGGEIVLELLAEEAPLTVHNFVRLARAGFFDDGVWHRVVPGFVLQDGAPAGDPSGGPGWTLRDEINRVRYERGTLGMAHSGADTGGSQWFITYAPQPHLDGGYTVFGRVRSGLEAADRTLEGDTIRSIRVLW